ncbi:MAG: 2Fe-2S iron-sulfur cluster-binding protein [bacterium]
MSAPRNVSVSVDGRSISGALHQPLIEALREAGIDVPTLCHRPGLSSYGACRLCVVEVTKGQGRTRLTTACDYPVLEGLKVRTDSDWVRRTRRGVLGLLSALAPGSPELAALVEAHGGEVTHSPDRDAERCIRCGLCVRVCAEVVGAEALGWHGRGTDRRVATPFDDWTEQCIGCGACASLCPTNAIHMEDEAVRRFVERSGAERLCRYALLGLTPGAVCPNSYQCWRCEVEQRFGDSLRAHPAFLSAASRVPASSVPVSSVPEVADYLARRAQRRWP